MLPLFISKLQSLFQKNLDWKLFEKSVFKQLFTNVFNYIAPSALAGQEGGEEIDGN